MFACWGECVSSLRSVCVPIHLSPHHTLATPMSGPPGWWLCSPGSVLAQAVHPGPSRTGTYKVPLHQVEPPLTPCFPGDRTLPGLSTACPLPQTVPPQLSPRPLCQLPKHPSSSAALVWPLHP